MRYLVGTDSVHTTAVACDYLEGRVAGEDEILFAAVVGDRGADERDAAEALNVARVRLTEPTVETLERTGDPATELRLIAEDREVDELVIGAHAGSPDAGGLGGTATTVLVESSRPVVVLPSPAPDDQ